MKLFLLFISLIIGCCAWTQPAAGIDSSYNNAYYKGRIELFESLAAPAEATVFLGNSITERGQWGELLPGEKVMNRGIGGDNTFGVLARITPIIQAKPKALFLLIGINDIGRGLPVAVIANNCQRIAEGFRQGSPNTRLYVQSVLPLNEKLLTAAYLKGKKDSITALNKALQSVARSVKATYIDLHPLFAGESGELKENITTDGIHLRPKAYRDWVQFLKEKGYLN